MSSLVHPDDVEAALARLHFTTPEQVRKPFRNPPHQTDSTSSLPEDPRTTTAGRGSRRGATVASHVDSPPLRPLHVHVPAEIILNIARHLHRHAVAPTALRLPTWHRQALADAAADDRDDVHDGPAPPPPSATSRRLALATLRSLSSTCTAYRALLAPLVWEHVTLSHPTHISTLRSLMTWYHTHYHPRAHSPKPEEEPPPPLTRHRPARPDDDDNDDDDDDDEGARPRRPAVRSDIHARLAPCALPWPMPLVRRLTVAMPESYASFDHAGLCELLRSGMAMRLRELTWDAELAPTAPILATLAAAAASTTTTTVAAAASAPSSYYHGVGHESADAEVVRWASESREGEPFPGTGAVLGAKDVEAADRYVGRSDDDAYDRSHDHSDAYDIDGEAGGGGGGGLVSLDVNCKMFWPGHATLSRLRTLRHVRLTHYDTFLLPPHLPPLLLSLSSPSSPGVLRTLSLSTSKTSALHARELIRSGAFASLESLDVYPVTPEEPLAEAILSARHTLRRLRLILDVSGGFDNYDRLWRRLAGIEAGEGAATEMETRYAPRLAAEVGEAGSASSSAAPVRSAATSSTATTAYPPHAAPPSLPPTSPPFPPPPLRRLEWLCLDPYPQPHTAPSFDDFARLHHAGGSLRRVNGRDVGPLVALRGVGMLNTVDPDHLTSALAY